MTLLPSHKRRRINYCGICRKLGSGQGDESTIVGLVASSTTKASVIRSTLQVPTALSFLCLMAISLCISVIPVSADSAIDLVAGFDADRITNAFPIKNKQSVGEVAKLLYRIRKVTPESFVKRYRADQTLGTVGDAAQLEGEFVSSRSYAVPDDLSELLGFDSFSVVDIRHDDDQPIHVIASSVPASCKPGDRLTVIGMVAATPDPENADGELDSDIGSVTVVAAKMTWHPRKSANSNWKWLADRGVDMANLPSLKNRDRRPLVAADADAFYSIMAAAAGPSPWPHPVAAKPVELLSDPNSWVASFITLPVEVVQVTRVSVTDPGRQRQLGRDHYFQIDTIGDLGNVVVKIESAKDNKANPAENATASEPATFENRYPVSVVMLDLPDFLKSAIRIREGGDAVVSDVRAMVQVDGFFFRLWSYETDYMKQFGDEKQFGPLLIAARMQNLESDSPDPLGVNIIGWIAAGLIGLSMVGIFLWHRLTSAGDAQVRRRRRDKSPVTIEKADQIDLSS